MNFVGSIFAISIFKTLLQDGQLSKIESVFAFNFKQLKQHESLQQFKRRGSLFVRLNF